MGHVRKLWYGEDEISEIDDQIEANRQTASLGGLVIALFLVVVGLFLIKELHAKASVEDCLLTGRTICDVMLLH